MKNLNVNCPTFETKIKERYDKLSKGQKRICDYIQSNPNTFAFMTAAEVANAVDISESTVVRFAKALGYSGYSELVRAFQENLKTRLTTTERFERSKSLADEKDIIKEIMFSDMENIKNTALHFDVNKLKRAVKQIKAARTIYIIGNRSSKMLAEYLYFYLSLIFDNIHLMSHGPNDIYDELINVSEKDVLVAFSYPRYANATIAAIDFAYQKKVKIIGFTDGLDSPIAAYSDLLLTTNHTMATFIDSLAAPISLTNALILALTMDEREKVKRKFDELEKVWAENAIYNRA